MVSALCTIKMTTAAEALPRLIPVKERETLRNNGYQRDANALLTGDAAL